MKGGVGRLASNWMRTTKGADGGLVVCVCVCVWRFQKLGWLRVGISVRDMTNVWCEYNLGRAEFKTRCVMEGS